MMGERYFERGGGQSSCCADSIELFFYEGEGISRYYFYSVFFSSFMVLSRGVASSSRHYVQIIVLLPLTLSPAPDLSLFIFCY